MNRSIDVNMPSTARAPRAESRLAVRRERVTVAVDLGNPLERLIAHVRSSRARRDGVQRLPQKPTRALALVVAAILAGAVPALAADAAIRGKVVARTVDRTEPFGGVTIVLRDASSQGSVAETTSDDGGDFTFRGVAPGHYLLTVTLDGFEDYVQDLPLASDHSALISVELVPKVLNESVDVTAEPSGVDRTETSVRESISTDTLSKVPLANEKFQEALPLLPGVVRGPDGLLDIKGARASQTGTLFSNLNAADPVTGNAALELPLEAVQSVNVYANPYDPEYGRFTGAVTQVETKSGGESWKYVLTDFLPRFRREDGAFYGLESATPRAAVSGPILKDRLFVFENAEYRFVRTDVPGLPGPNNDTKLESFDTFTRFDYAPTTRDLLAASVSVSPQKLDFYNLNTFVDSRTAANLHRRGWFVALREQHALASGASLESDMSVRHLGADVLGNTDDAFVISPQSYSGGWFDRQHRDTGGFEWRETYALPAVSWQGTHAIKLGVDLSHSTVTGSIFDRAVQVERLDGSLSQTIDFVGRGALDDANTETSAFVQDKWTVSDWLTLDGGLRFDHDSLSNGSELAPRLGVALLPFRRPNTVVRGGVGVFYSGVSLGVGQFENYPSEAVTRFGADGRTPMGPTLLFRNATDPHGLSMPRSVAWNVQLDHEFTDRLMLRLGYEARRTTRDFLVDPEVGAGASELRLSSTGASRYREFQAVGRFSVQRDRYIYASYTHSRATGDLNDFATYFGDIRQPVVRPNEYRRLPFDAPNRVLVWGEIGLPANVSLVPVADTRTGFPYSAVDANRDFVGPRNGAGRFPTFFSLDMQVVKDIHIPFRGRRIGMRAGVKFFNLTNHWNPRDVQNSVASPDFNAFSNSVGRTIRLKLEFIDF